MHSTPVHPIDTPIRSPSDAKMALRSMKIWMGTGRLLDLDDTDRDLVVDRVLEILAFRLSQAWQAFNKENPIFPEVEFRFYSPRGMKFLLVASYCSDDSGISSDWDLPGFSDAALFVSKRNADLVRKALRRRFGRSPMAWPPLYPNVGTDSLLHALMTPAHRMRREASIIDQSTAICRTKTYAPRL